MLVAEQSSVVRTNTQGERSFIIRILTRSRACVAMTTSYLRHLLRVHKSSAAPSFILLRSITVVMSSAVYSNGNRPYHITYEPERSAGAFRLTTMLHLIITKYSVLNGSGACLKMVWPYVAPHALIHLFSPLDYDYRNLPASYRYHIHIRL